MFGEKLKKAMLVAGMVLMGLSGVQTAQANGGKYNYYYPMGGQNGCNTCRNVMPSPCRYYDDSFYIAGRVGITRATQKTAFDGDTDNALTYGGAFGFAIPRSPVRIEAEVMSYQLDYGNKNEAEVYNWMGNIYIDFFPKCTRFSPFIFGGAGAMTFDGDNGKDDYLAYQVGGGLSYRFARPVALEVRYAYQSLFKKEDLEDNKYGFNHAHQLTAGLRFYF